ncbi:MAG: HAD family hydrolase [Kiritimatiellae bacterium]|nr:HAD family hydrolase [Kiritimatiellia bacterium]
MARKCIFWDWNGTLLDDTLAALNTLNTMLVKRGSPGISMGFYRDNFAFPVKPFYQRIGMVLENENWDDVAKEYHDIYATMPRSLNEGAIEALDNAASFGIEQYVVSALRQDLLEEELTKRGIISKFASVSGVDNLDGAGKILRAKNLLATLGDCNVVVIGDSLHDMEMAQAIEAKCVLCSQGSHAHWRLERVAPTAHTLIQAVDMAIKLL